VSFVSLTDYPCLIALAEEKGIVTGEQVRILLEWRKDPALWTGS
jgi:orotate phosphoribosyltransferase